MSASNDMSVMRAWMYNRWDPVRKANTPEFVNGLREFINLASSQESARQCGMISCPCVDCKNCKLVAIDKVASHVFKKGFVPGYYRWLFHGEHLEIRGGASSSSGTVERLVIKRRRKRKGGLDSMDTVAGVTFVTHETDTAVPLPPLETEPIGTIEMVNEAFREEAGVENMDAREEPNANARKFFEMLDSASNPLYEGCKVGHSPLSVASRMMAIKTDNNLSESCVDQILEFLKDYLPEGNLAPGTNTEVERLVGGMGLPFQMIDVCSDNCMIYWGVDKDRESCKVCEKARWQVTGGRTKVPFKRMWYLPIADRLKRLYQSHVTAEAMRWHAEHNPEGEISHPSDAKAWQHFKAVYPEFARESRNVYLGLCTDGFNPFGKSGRKYSLWPVIVTPYNLPPSLCMKREYLYLSVIVPGPDHPKRALDVFLQPLVAELQLLWSEGVEAYDLSRSQNFQLRAVLMWTISDFPAYGMLAGWTTHGKLSCPYCGKDTDSFQLRNGRKTSWFDCHRRFLDARHPYRKSKRLFRKNRIVLDMPPKELNGQEVLDELNHYGVERTEDCGGNGHKKYKGYGRSHNWHKKAFFGISLIGRTIFYAITWMLCISRRISSTTSLTPC